MAFSKEHLRSIRKVVRDFCERRVPLRFQDQLRLVYTIEGQNVIIRESRPEDRDPSQWFELDVAKLRYVKQSNEWKLYWKRASGKWWPYVTRTRSKSLIALVKEIDADEYGCFFG